MSRASMVALVYFALVVVGCGDEVSPPTNTENANEVIEWFEGGVEEAFAFAKEAGKPVFLYWGADWCPPCHNLKKNFFSKKEFIEASRRFVPVYLDGDTKRAQLWAERFKIAGYPTVILFSPTGVELFRMPTDVSAEQYGVLLEAAISDFRPVEKILDEVMESGLREADQRDLELIAFHSWAQDPNADLTDSEAFDVFWRCYTETPPESRRLRSRFMILTLERAIPRIGVVSKIFGSGDLVVIDEEHRLTLRSGLLELLGDPDLRTENKVFLTLQSRRAVEALEPEPSIGRDELVEAWVSAAVEMQEDPRFSATEQLMAFVPEFELLPLQGHVEGEPVPDELREKVRARADRVVAEADDPGEFQSTLNMTVWLLGMAGLKDEAKAMLDEHLDETVAPHYFLSLLGDLNADDPEVALDWYRQAFEQAGQGSSGIKWGTTYILKLIQLTPDDAAAVDGACRRLIGLMISNEDAFAGRNVQYLGSLENTLLTWAESTDNEEIIDGLRVEISEQCDRFKGDIAPEQVERCLAFLVQPESS